MSIKEFLKEVIKFTVLAIVVVVPIRAYVAQPFIVDGSSMEPTFDGGEYLIIDEISYNFRDPARGDVLVFKYPLDPKKYFIKRLIGLPGETVTIKNGKVSVKTAADQILNLDESYVILEKDDSLERHLQAGEYFVMGDNRAGSFDSRSWGPVPKKDITGRALLRLLPITKISVYPGSVNYNK